MKLPTHPKDDDRLYPWVTIVCADCTSRATVRIWVTSAHMDGIYPDPVYLCDSHARLRLGAYPIPWGGHESEWRMSWRLWLSPKERVLDVLDWAIRPCVRLAYRIGQRDPMSAEFAGRYYGPIG